MPHPTWGCLCAKKKKKGSCTQERGWVRLHWLRREWSLLLGWRKGNLWAGLYACSCDQQRCCRWWCLQGRMHTHLCVCVYVLLSVHARNYKSCVWEGKSLYRGLTLWDMFGKLFFSFFCRGLTFFFFSSQAEEKWAKLGHQGTYFHKILLHTFLFVLSLIWIYGIGLISAVQQIDAVILAYIYIYMCVCVFVYILFHVFSHYGLSQDTEYNSLCCTLGPSCLSILYKIVCLC